MAIQKVFAVVALLLAAPVSVFSAPLGKIRVSMVEGDAQFRTRESGEWVLSSINTALAEGDELWVPEGGRLELQLDDGTYVRLDQETALEILSTDKDALQLFLAKGRVYVLYEGQSGGVLQFDTPQVSAHARARCAFGLETWDEYTDVSVYKGAIDVENQEGRTRLNAGKMLSLGLSTEADTAPLGSADDWELWNQERNRGLLSSGPSVHYLPNELRPFYTDFNDNGEWESSGEYGRVWVPRDTADPDWSPYRNGRWMWRGGDYVWVAYERWGWVPYHYGRWVFLPPFGWCWVPPSPRDVIWGPGFVGWVRTPDYVAWVPLAPRETYYGRGDYGPHSVNITRVTINIRNVQVYRNGRARNGVAVIHRDTFVGGLPPPSPFDVDEIRRRIFRRQNLILGAPSIAPSRTSFMPIIRAVPTPLRPPFAFERDRADTPRHRRPFVKRPEESVLRPGRAPALLPVRVLPDRRPRHERGATPERGNRDRNRDDDRFRGHPPREERDTRPPERGRERIGILPGEDRGEQLREPVRPPDRGRERIGILPGEDRGEQLREPSRDKQKPGEARPDRRRQGERSPGPETTPRIDRSRREDKPTPPETAPPRDRDVKRGEEGVRERKKIERAVPPSEELKGSDLPKTDKVRETKGKGRPMPDAPTNDEDERTVPGRERRNRR